VDHKIDDIDHQKKGTGIWAADSINASYVDGEKKQRRQFLEFDG